MTAPDPGAALADVIRAAKAPAGDRDRVRPC